MSLTPFLLLFPLVFVAAPLLAAEETNRTDPDLARPPNVIVILTDDMGYGDTSLNGHPTIQTPQLDRMAAQGQNWTNFYVAASVCSPSRAGLLTGRLPVRSGMASSKHRVFFPWSKGGIPESEFTLAELFKSRGYATAMIGKWHLGHQPEFLPTRHGFDTWFGIPYSNDMDKTPEARKLLRNRKTGQPGPAAAWYKPKSEWFEVPLMRGDRVIEIAPNQALLTERYTEEALQFMRAHRDQPFFIYLGFSMPHVPLFRSAAYEGHSAGGIYGDVIEEIDGAVGRILEEVRKLGLENDTLVVFTSDNGPWLPFQSLAGSAGPFRDGKSTAWEGGFRVPAIFWGPGTVSPGNVEEMGSTLDFMATFASLLDTPLPDAELDSFNLMPVLANHGTSPRNKMFFYVGEDLAAARSGSFKAHFSAVDPGSHRATPLEAPTLYNLDQDPAERFDLAASKPEVVSEIRKLRDSHLESVALAENQLTRR